MQPKRQQAVVIQIVNPPVKLDVIQVVMLLAEVAAKVVATTLAQAVAKTPAPVVVEVPLGNSSDLFMRL